MKTATSCAQLPLAPNKRPRYRWGLRHQLTCVCKPQRQVAVAPAPALAPGNCNPPEVHLPTRISRCPQIDTGDQRNPRAPPTIQNEQFPDTIYELHLKREIKRMDGKQHQQGGTSASSRTTLEEPGRSYRSLSVITSTFSHRLQAMIFKRRVVGTYILPHLLLWTPDHELLESTLHLIACKDEAMSRRGHTEERRQMYIWDEKACRAPLPSHSDSVGHSGIVTARGAARGSSSVDRPSGY